MSVYFHWPWHSYSQEPELQSTFLSVTERWITADTYKYPPVRICRWVFFFFIDDFFFTAGYLREVN